ncbi:receptor-like protein kinase FERONIA [Rutidosis leptorrhynchoides]|uniref:receptor-like protein kinase FERONIA n=1 Tax=Rutidosis leptorrhynchoides TaxID=125765 RepID=UPI003A98D0AE
MDIVRIPLYVLQHATKNFIRERFTGSVGASKNVHVGKIPHGNRVKSIVAKRLDRTLGDHVFYRELDILLKFKHKNIVNLEGYCDEEGEKIIVYESPLIGRLDWQLNENLITWMKRLEICIDIATGLDFLHGSLLRRETVIHGDINSCKVQLTKDLKAKISDFGRAFISPTNQESIKHIINDPAGEPLNCDQEYAETGVLTTKSDIYSFGVVLFEILCGRYVYSYPEDQPLTYIVKHLFEEGKLDKIVFEGIKGKIGPQSFDTFTRIAYQCIDDDREKRPTASEVLVQLKKALDFQVSSQNYKTLAFFNFLKLVSEAVEDMLIKDIFYKQKNL